MKRTWVVSSAGYDEQGFCTMLHFWTERGLTTGSGRANGIAANARRYGWKETIIVRAPTHRDACVKAFALFATRRQKRTVSEAEIRQIMDKERSE